jgi:hypothetical protein
MTTHKTSILRSTGKDETYLLIGFDHPRNFSLSRKAQILSYGEKQHT